MTKSSSVIILLGIILLGSLLVSNLVQVDLHQTEMDENPLQLLWGEQTSLGAIDLRLTTLVMAVVLFVAVFATTQVLKMEATET